MRKVSQGRACGAPGCGCDLAGVLPPALRIHAGSSFSLTAKPACFLASAACMTPHRSWSRGQVSHDWYGMFQVEPCTAKFLQRLWSSCRPQHDPLRLEAKGVLAEAHLGHSRDWRVPCTGGGLLTVSFWFCAGLDSLLGGAGLAVLASGLEIEAFSLAGALAALLLPWGALLFSLLPPGSACTASRRESLPFTRAQNPHKNAGSCWQSAARTVWFLKSCGQCFHHNPKLIPESQMLMKKRLCVQNILLQRSG